MGFGGEQTAGGWDSARPRGKANTGVVMPPRAPCTAMS